MRIDYHFTYASQFKRHFTVNFINLIMALLTLPIIPILSVLEQFVFKSTYVIDRLIPLMLIIIIIVFTALTLKYYLTPKGVCVDEDKLIISYGFYYQNSHAIKHTVRYSSIKSVELKEGVPKKKADRVIEAGAYDKPYVSINMHCGTSINLTLDSAESFIHNVNSRLTADVKEF